MRRRNAYTLMELLLVLAILVAVAAASAPAFTGAMRHAKLSSAADVVRTEWTRAHVRAMKTGRIQVFRYEVGGAKYMLQPWVGGDDSLESDTASQDATNFGGAEADLPPEETGAEQSLPEGIVFVIGEAGADQRGATVSEGVMGTSSGQADWSSPILFYPDGSSMDAFVLVGDDREAGIRVDLRGMTGAVKVSEIGSLDDLSQLATDR